jgi:hypothetical protein
LLRRREGTKSIRSRKARVEIDLETLIWTRGERRLLSMLESPLSARARVFVRSADQSEAKQA